MKKGKFKGPVDESFEGDTEGSITLSDMDPEDIALIVRVFQFATDHGMYLRDAGDRTQLRMIPRRLQRVMHDEGIPYFPEGA